MPKMKTNSGARKRLKVRKGGTIKRAVAGRRHMLKAKKSKTKRQMGLTAEVHASDVRPMKQMLPYS